MSGNLSSRLVQGYLPEPQNNLVELSAGNASASERDTLTDIEQCVHIIVLGVIDPCLFEQPQDTGVRERRLVNLFHYQQTVHKHPEWN